MKKTVCVVTPVYRLPITEDEIISLNSIRSHLKGYDRAFLVPKRLKQRIGTIHVDEKIVELSNHFFSDICGYNSLMLSSVFYERFSEYDYILIAQLDSLVLSDKLKYWCDGGWDYIGAPWMKNYGYHTKSEFISVGNGGFSLRRVRAAIDVLKTKWKDFGSELQKEDKKLWRKSKKLKIESLSTALGLFISGSVESYLKRHFTGNEDVFWSEYAALISNGFSIPSPETGLNFAFEMEPAESYLKNNSQLPFGCHAWARYDRSFWEKHSALKLCPR